MSALQALMQLYQPAIEAELQNAVDLAGGERTAELREMLAYHMGWEGEGAGPEARGKRIRPLLVVLSCTAAGGDWLKALPAAAGVELVHNFSLIHDDIEDDSATRRGRLTVWKKWGIAQAINTGDALFTIAHLALLRLQAGSPAAVTLQAAQLLQETCFRLTEGQYLDISYEARRDLSIDSYWPMIAGKTAALLSACTGLGSLIAEAPAHIQQAYRRFGEALGLAFQVQDDLLGIWGDTGKIGKSTASDLLTGKKSLPVLYGLEQKGPFAERWYRGGITEAEVPGLAEELSREGARVYTEKEASRLTQEALASLQAAHPQGEAGAALEELANHLLSRQM